MKKIKSIKLILIAFLLGGGFTSCDYLDMENYFSDLTSMDSVWTRQNLLEEYIGGTSSLLPNEGKLFTAAYAPYFTATDESFMSWKDSRHAGMYFWVNEETPFTGNFNNYGSCYQGIRKANLILANIDRCAELSDLDRRDYRGMAYFLRGYFYYHLLQQYGPVPIVPDEPMDMGASTEALCVERATYDEVCDYICENMELAAKLLMDTRDATVNFYRPTSGAAMSVVSRVRLYQASKQYNGGQPYFNDWIRESDGAYYVSQEYKPEKWGKAAAAALRVIETGRYSLYIAYADDKTPELPAQVTAKWGKTWPDGPVGIDPYKSYSETFNGEAIALKNPEIILPVEFWRKSGTNDESPEWASMPLKQGGANGLNVTQDLVDAYYMADGSEYKTAMDYYEPIGSGKTFSGYELPGKVAKMYDNREMRFYATIGFCEAKWPGSSYTGTDNECLNYITEYYADGNCQPQSAHPEDYNHTGYTCRKYIHEEDNFATGGRVKDKVFPIFRYAEILLNYAEALNEMRDIAAYQDTVTGLTVAYDPQKIADAFNPIRFRAGLPGITAAEVSAMTKEECRELIMRERQIEFAMEGRRYHDIRRWGIAMDVMNRPARGMDVTGKKSDREKFYRTVTVNFDLALKHTFLQKMFFFPIPSEVVRKNNKMVQNPGY